MHNMAQIRKELLNPIEFDDDHSGYYDGSDFWRADSLAKAVKEQKCKPYKYPLKYFCGSNKRWATERPGYNVFDLAGAVKRVQQTSLKYPVIISPMGTLLDGYHRIVKALVKGDDYVMAVRLLDMPPPDEVNDMPNPELETPDA